MHDLHLADKILKTAIEAGNKNNITKINSIKIDLGKIIEHGERVTPEGLKINFDMLSKGTIANGAELIINSVEGELWKLKEINGD